MQMNTAIVMTADVHWGRANNHPSSLHSIKKKLLSRVMVPNLDVWIKSEDRKDV